MSEVIYKYPIECVDEQSIDMPTDARILSVQVHRGVPCLWALVDTALPVVSRRIFTFGTEHPLCDAAELRFIDTYQSLGGDLVFHVFENPAPFFYDPAIFTRKEP